MSFNEQFNQNKIPEWQRHYVDYISLIQIIEDFTVREKQGEVCQLPGIYYYSMPLKMPVVLSFDVVKKDRMTISASEAYQKLSRSNTLRSKSIEAELKNLKSTNEPKPGEPL